MMSILTAIFTSLIQNNIKINQNEETKLTQELQQSTASSRVDYEKSRLGWDGRLVFRVGDCAYDNTKVVNPNLLHEMFGNVIRVSTDSIDKDTWLEILDPRSGCQKIQHRYRLGFTPTGTHADVTNWKRRFLEIIADASKYSEPTKGNIFSLIQLPYYLSSYRPYVNDISRHTTKGINVLYNVDVEISEPLYKWSHKKNKVVVHQHAHHFNDGWSENMLEGIGIQVTNSETGEVSEPIDSKYTMLSPEKHSGSIELHKPCVKNPHCNFMHYMIDPIHSWTLASAWGIESIGSLQQRFWNQGKHKRQQIISDEITSGVLEHTWYTRLDTNGWESHGANLPDLTISSTYYLESKVDKIRLKTFILGQEYDGADSKNDMWWENHHFEINIKDKKVSYVHAQDGHTTKEMINIGEKEFVKSVSSGTSNEMTSN